MKKVGRKRADELVVSLGLCESRTQAQAYILAGKVRMGTERIELRCLSEGGDLR